MFTEKQINLFWNKVTRADGCWLWNASMFPNGYGQTSFTYYGERYAHRVSWMINFGDIPHGMLVMHICDNPPCVNPSHLKLGTSRDNILDMFSKGRGNRAYGERQGLSKLTEDQVYDIRKLIAGGEPDTSISKLFSVSNGTVWAIRVRRSWKYLPTPSPSDHDHLNSTP